MSLASLIWLSVVTKAAITAFFAAFGGGVLIWGLVLEWRQEKRSERDWFSNINDFRNSKQKSKQGEKWVIAGVAIEVVVAVVFAVTDVCEKYKINANAAAHDPANLPIERISGYAKIEVWPPYPNFARNLRLNGLYGDFPEEISDPKELQNDEVVELGFGTHPYADSASEIDFNGWIGSKRELLIDHANNVHKIRFDVFFDTTNSGFPSWVALNPHGVTFNELKFVGFSLRDVMPPPIQIATGVVTISVNHVGNGVKLEKTFFISAQTNLTKPIGFGFENDGS